jgi:hypothetical protein
MNRGREKPLFFVFSGGAVFAAHTEIGGAAVDTFIRAVSVNMFSGWSLEAPIAVGG